MTESAVEEDFQTLAEPFRRELLAYCYRMLGSVQRARRAEQRSHGRAGPVAGAALAGTGPGRDGGRGAG